MILSDGSVVDTTNVRLCPAIAFDRIVGGRYKLRILWTLTQGTKRYGEIGRSLLRGTLGKPITPRILSRELKDLEACGLIARKAFPVVPPKVEYSLTERGKTLLPILNEIVVWGMTGIHEEILRDEISETDHAAERRTAQARKGA
jgi:DNA-binding HxlR family transcriptional regulator